MLYHNYGNLKVPIFYKQVHVTNTCLLSLWKLLLGSRKNQTLLIISFILDIQLSTSSSHLTCTIYIQRLKIVKSMQHPKDSLHKSSRGIVQKSLTLPGIEYWVMTMVAKFLCKFCKSKILSLIGVMFRILMSIIVALNKISCHPNILVLQFFLSICDFYMPRWSNIFNHMRCAPQSHFPIFKLSSNSQWSTMLSMERSLCCTFKFCNSDMVHTKAQAQLDLLYPEPWRWSHYCHLVGPINMMLAFGRCTLSHIYNSRRVPPFHHSV